MNKGGKRIAIQLLILPLFFTYSCHSDNRGRAVAKVGGDYLYIKDLADAMPKGMNKEDSLQFSASFITSWIKEELMYRKADKTLNSEEKNKDKQLNEYYRSLLRQELLKKELNKIPGKNVTENEIQAYYTENTKNFELKRNVIRFIYVKLRLDAPNALNAIVWVKKHDKASMEKLKEYSKEYALNYNLDTTQWYYFDDITKEIPIIENYNPEHFVQNNNYVELRDASHQYLLNVIDNRIRDDISPLNLVRGRIKNILLNIRRVKEIEKMENKVYEDAATNNDFQIYKK